MSGMPCVLGTRVPATTVVAEIREEILDHYPTLPRDAVKAVRRWAAANGVSLAPENGKR
jgi:uncharacterized protein (DUF433 family)